MRSLSSRASSTAARWCLAIAWSVAPGLAHAQEAQPASDQTPRWTGAVDTAIYVVPNDPNFVQPTLYADRGRLHVEARYNYEAQQTGSLWVGANFELGERIALALTPMFGVVLGDTDGVAPGLELTLAAWRLELYSESEWVIDTGDKADSFYYNWSELSVQLTDWARAGLVAQRTRVYQSDREIQRGILAGVQWKQVSLTGHVFEPFSDTRTYVISLAFEF